VGRLAGFRYTTIPNHPGDLPEGTVRAILRQAAVNVDEFLEGSLRVDYQIPETLDFDNTAASVTQRWFT